MSTEKDVFYMTIAIKEARLSLNGGDLPVGAIICAGENIVGRGRRNMLGNTRLDHAEMNALSEAVTDWRGEHLVLYTTLEPCIMCFGAILNCRIGRVVYALEDPYGGATELDRKKMPPRHQIKYPDITKGVLREDSRQIFREYFQTTDNDFWKNNLENPFFKLCMNID